MTVDAHRTWFASLAEIGADQSYGAKVANTSALSQAGFKVPDSWAIRVSDVDRILNMGENRSQAILNNLCSDKHLRDAAYGLVVRSSFSGEDDAPDSSFAGMFESVFAARKPTELRDSLARCLNSLRRTSPHASMKLPSRSDGGILIQAAIRPLMSGVYFSHAPFDAMSDCIEVTRGLSIDINSGLIEPERFQQPRTAGIEDRKLDELLSRQQAVVLLPASSSDLSVPPADFVSYGRNGHAVGKILAHIPDSNLLAVEGRQRLGLDRGAAERILSLVRTLGWSVSADLMRCAVDVEWCVDETGTVWIIQARRALDRPQARPPTTPGSTSNDRWLGTPASAGSATGQALVAQAEVIPDQPEGPYVLVLDCVEQTPVELILGASAIVSRDMGLLSHTAILARELGIPCVIDAHEVAENVQVGDILSVVGEQGLIERTPLSSGPRLLSSPQDTEAGPRLPFAEFHYILGARGLADSAHRCPQCLVYDIVDEIRHKRRCSLNGLDDVAGYVTIGEATALAYVHWTSEGPTKFVLRPRYKTGTLCFLLSIDAGGQSITKTDTCCSFAVPYRIIPRLDLLN